MKRYSGSVSGAFFILAVVLGGNVQHAQACESTVTFPAVSGSGVLTISGGSFRHREVYADGDYPTLCAIYNSGQPLTDGEYRYQLRSVPVGGPSTARQRQFLSDESPPRGSGNSRGATILSGTFAIVGGEFAIP